MPQFDISSFNVQLFWLFVSFLAFYFILTWKFLPSAAFLLKTRKKPLSLQAKESLSFENYKTAFKEKTAISKNTTKTSKIFFIL